AASLEVHASIPVEGLAAPDFLDRRVVQIGKLIRSAEGNVLAAQRDPAERVDVEPLERPHARLLLLRRPIAVEVLVERLAEVDGGVVVPAEELAGDDVVDADFLEPEVARLVDASLDLLLADDRHHDARRD